MLTVTLHVVKDRLNATSVLDEERKLYSDGVLVLPLKS